MSTDKKSRIAVLGAGAWGTALACLVANNGYPCQLWVFEKDQIEPMRRARENARYLPGIALPETLEIESDLHTIAQTAEHFLIVVPSHAFRATIENIKLQRKANSILAWATKGLAGDGALLSEIVYEVCGPQTPAAAVSGPTYAGEEARNLPSAIAVAGKSADAQTVAAWLRRDSLRVYTNTDIVGVQLGGAIKNVIAIAAGISDGLGFGANARAALITRGLAEIMRLGTSMGGKRETFMGLTGAGDLILTCTDNQSRNRRFGLALAQGQSREQASKAIGQEIEGIHATKIIHALAQKQAVELPIIEQVYRILFENVAPRAAVGELLKRQAKEEF